jgi:hypothetical protein
MSNSYNKIKSKENIALSSARRSTIKGLRATVVHDIVVGVEKVSKRGSASPSVLGAIVASTVEPAGLLKALNAFCEQLILQTNKRVFREQNDDEDEVEVFLGAINDSYKWRAPIVKISVEIRFNRNCVRPLVGMVTRTLA